LLNNNKNIKNGFSLMELIIIIVIIGILISVVIGLNKQRESAKIVAAEKIINNLKNSSEMWKVCLSKNNFQNISINNVPQKSCQSLIKKFHNKTYSIPICLYKGHSYIF